MCVAQIGVLMSLMQIMRIFGPNLWGWVADRSQKRVLVLRTTALAAALAFGGMLFGQTLTQFLAVMIVVNLFTGAQGPLSEALMLSEMRGDQSQSGRIRLRGSVGFIASVTVAGELLARFGILIMPWIAFTLLCMVFLV